MNSQQHPSGGSIFRTILVAIALFAGGLYTCAGAQPQFQIEVVDHVAGLSNSFPDYASLVIDAAGVPHIGYVLSVSDLNRAERAVRYASREGGSWTIETVAQGYSAGNTNLVIDANGVPLMSWAQASDAPVRLLFAKRINGAWGVEVVDSRTFAWDPAYGQPSLALNPLTNEPSIVYHDQQDQQLKVARRTPSGWVKETIGPSIGGASAKYDQLGHLKIVHLRWAPSGETLLIAEYVSEDGSGWHHERVGTDPCLQASLDLAANGEPVVGYWNYNPWVSSSPREAKVAFRDGGVWTTEVIENGGNGVTIAVGPTGEVHAAYQVGGATAPGHHYAIRTGTGWSPSTVSSEPLGDAEALAFGPTGLVNLAFGTPPPTGGAGYLYWARQVPAQSMLTASAGAGGAISPSGSVSVVNGSEQTFTIAPEACHTIADVLVDGSSVGALASYTFSNVSSNHTIAASFNALNPPPVAGPPHYLKQWGTFGTGPGQFDNPQKLATDNDGNLYVVDVLNNRIQKFTGSGVFLTQWGSYGTGNGQFGYPKGVAVDSAGYVYVADINNQRIQKFTSNGTYVTKWGGYGSSAGRFVDPIDVATDGAGNVYVADLNNHRIQKFTGTGEYLAQWGSFGTDLGQFYAPHGLATDAAGNVYVADLNNNRIQKFTSNGAYLTQFGSLGSGDGQVDRPVKVAADRAGNVYVADYGNNRIVEFDTNGCYLTQWGGCCTEAGHFRSPYGVAVDRAGNVFVADLNNHRIQKFGTVDLVPIVVGPRDSSYQCASAVPAAMDSQAIVSDDNGIPVVTVTETTNGGAGSPTSPLIITRTWTATDGAGQTASATQIITVVDNTAPTVSAPANVTVIAGPGVEACPDLRLALDYGTASATDNCGRPTVSTSGAPPDGKFSVGTTLITHTATDVAGNSASAVQTITVQCPLGTIAGNANQTCNGATTASAGATVRLLHEGHAFREVRTGADGAYRFDEVRLGTYTVQILPPADYGVPIDTRLVTLAGEGTTLAVEPFVFTCLLGDLAGRVEGTCNGTTAGLRGVTIDLFREDGHGLDVLVGTMGTDAQGNFRFDDLALGGYSLSMVSPLGYSAANATAEVSITQPDGLVQAPRFTLACQANATQVQGMGYWKHQTNVYLSGKGSAQESLNDLLHYIDLMVEHFNQNLINPVIVYLPGSSNTTDKLLQLQQLLTVNRSATGLDRAKQHLLSLLLNVVSAKISQTAVVSDNGATVSQAITYCHDLIVDGIPGNDGTAQTIAESINDGRQVPAGMIPIKTRVIAYHPVPATDDAPTLRLDSVNPSPVRGACTVTFSLMGQGPAWLEVLDVAGRRLMRQEVGALGAGRHSLGILDGTSITPGVYALRLSEGGRTVGRTLVVVR